MDQPPFNHGQTSQAELHSDPAKVSYVVTEGPLDDGAQRKTEEVTIDSVAGHHLDHNSAALHASWRMKAVALAFIMLFPLGQTWTNGSLGPLKNTLRQELKINNTQFGVISASDAIINSIWPIIGGLCLDYFGPNIIISLCTGITVLGTVLAALATTLTYWRLLVAGHIVMGFGIAVLDTAQQKLFYHWFGAGGLAFAFGLENAVNRTVDLVSGMTAIPIRDGTGWYGYSFWIPVAFSVASFLSALAYLLFERSPRCRNLRLVHRQADGSKFNIKMLVATITTLPWSYWMLPMTQLLQSGAAGGFSTSLADIIRIRGFEEDIAGYLSSAQNILPIVLSPLLGAAIDRYGHRFHYVALAPILWIIACSTIGFTGVHPVVSLVFSSLAGVINAMPLQVCIPLLVADQTKLGTAFGVWRAFNNSGSTIVDIVFGVLQDGTADGGYCNVLSFAMGVKSVAFCLGIAYIIVDYRHLGRGMTMTRAQRRAREAVITDAKTDPLTRRIALRSVTWSGLGLLSAMIITAWVVFVRYLL